MTPSTQRWFAQGAAGQIECLVDLPEGFDPHSASAQSQPWALIAHPHPLFGGTADNKVVTTLARACLQQGMVTVRPNFRGVGGSQGAHDEGHGESDDLAQVVSQWVGEHAWADSLPVCVAGFSFGTFVCSKLIPRLWPGSSPQHVLFIGTATSRFAVQNAPEHTLVVHGELDETVPLQTVFEWARPQQLSVLVMTGADHFFHKRLTQLKFVVMQYLERRLPQ